MSLSQSLANSLSDGENRYLGTEVGRGDGTESGLLIHTIHVHCLVDYQNCYNIDEFFTCEEIS